MSRFGRLPHLGGLIPLVLQGCESDQGLGKNGEHGGTEGPAIEVYPRELDFGALTAGEVATGTFSVTNVGVEGSILDVSDIRLTGPAGGYSIVSGTTSFSLTPDDVPQVIEVAFTPLGANAQLSEAIVDSNDEESPHVTVDLAGEGFVPELSIDPDPLDMGETFVGCSKDNVLTLANVGTDLLTISDLTHLGPTDTFVFTNPNPMPINLEPGQTTEVYLDFWPQSDVDYTTQLVATSNEPIVTRTADQLGRGAYAGDFSDNFDVPETPTTDILFVIDDSSSMTNEQQNLTNNFTAFASGLSGLGVDFQLAIITTDEAQFQGPIMTPSTANLTAEFVSQANVGTTGASNEMPTEMAYQATQRGADAGPGSTFLRDDAMLSMIFVSDEPDSSPSDWASYLAHFQSLKANPDFFIAHAISGDWPSGCSDASATNNIYEITVATGGLYLSVCASDWSSHMAALADASITQTVFTLTRTAAPSTIVVYVNGAVRADGWSYDATSNSVVFTTDAAPDEGDHVQIDYAGLGGCD